MCVTTRTAVSAGIRSRIRRGRAPYATPQWMGGKLGTGRGIGPVCRMGWDGMGRVTGGEGVGAWSRTAVVRFGAWQAGLRVLWGAGRGCRHGSQGASLST